MQSRSSRKVDQERPLLPVYAVVFVACLLGLFACASTGCKGDRLLDNFAERVYVSAPEGQANATPAFISFATPGGVWQIRAEGLYREGEWLRAERVVAKGMYVTVERSPFAWRATTADSR